jgi:carbon monoxide dehydrogenase subunit G
VKIDYGFTVGVPVDQAWSRMLDLEKIAPCLPGAAIQEEIGDGEYAGTMKVEIGPITVGYKGTVKFEETDERDHRAVLQATGRETRGQGTASATIVSTLREDSDGTRVNVEADLMLTGRVAQFGRGIAQGVATEVLDEFAACLEREISGGNAAEAAEPASERGADADANADGKAVPAARTAGGISSGEVPAVAAGAIVEGATVAGSNPSEAAAGAPTTPTQQPTIQAMPRREPPKEPEASDLGAGVRDATPKRLPPVLAGFGALLVLLWLLRRKR